jgi:hypothetical protein
MDDRKPTKNNTSANTDSFLSKESEIADINLAVDNTPKVQTSTNPVLHQAEEKTATSFPASSPVQNNVYSNSIYQPVYTSSNGSNTAVQTPAPPVAPLEQGKPLEKAPVVTPISAPERPKEKIIYRDKKRGCGCIGDLVWRVISFFGCLLFLISAIIIGFAFWINF